MTTIFLSFTTSHKSVARQKMIEGVKMQIITSLAIMDDDLKSG